VPPQHEERLALGQDTITARLVGGLAFLHAACGAVVDGARGYHQHRDNGQDAGNTPRNGPTPACMSAMKKFKA
jgi:hypothetical protein